jgi:hypothetical protein
MIPGAAVGTTSADSGVGSADRERVSGRAKEE